MKSRIVLMCGVLILLFSTTSRADLSEERFAFSRLFAQSDIVVTGYVNGVDGDAQWHLVSFNVESVIKGATTDIAILVGTPKGRNGGRLEDETYLWKSPLRLILFLQFDATNHLWRITNKQADMILRAEATGDVRAIYQSLSVKSKSVLAKRLGFPASVVFLVSIY